MSAHTGSWFLGVDDNDLASCVACGLCLPHCPTYRVTGNDASSPRGRIALVSAVKAGDLPLDDGVRSSLESCVQCMGCLPACPSGVRYDRIIEPVIEELTARSGRRRVRRRFLLSPLGRPRVLRVLTMTACALQRLHLLPKRLPVPPLHMRNPRLRPTTAGGSRGEVVVFTGCVMDAWFRDVHRATRDVLEAMGFAVSFSDPSLCCGALHAHAGLVSRAARFSSRLSRTHSGDTIVVNSAGCGARLSETIGHEGKTHVFDVMEFIDRNLDALREALGGTFPTSGESVIVHDACHLRNLQRTHLAAHRVLGAFMRVIPIPDDGLCCGAGGSYSIEHPESARVIADRKFLAIESVADGTTATISSGNPGCIGQLIAHKSERFEHFGVVHPVQLVARMLESVGKSTR